MSVADSARQRGGRPAMGTTLRPEQVAEKSFMESMAGFMKDVVPQTYALAGEQRADPVLWTRIERLEPHDRLLPQSSAAGDDLPLLLVLGYANGIQMWALLASGEAQEILSWRHGATKTARLVPTPEPTPSVDADAGGDVADAFADKRPLVAVCEAAPPGSAFHPITFVSLRTGEQVKTIRFKNAVSDVLVNRRVVVVTFPEKVAVFSSRTLEDQVVLTHCYPAAGPCTNPVALGTRWLAYAEKRLVALHRSGGGFEGEGIQSYTATVIHAAKSITKGLRDFGETFANSLTGSTKSVPSTPVPAPAASLASASAWPAVASSSSSSAGSPPQPGVVTVLDLDGVGRGQVNVADDVSGVVAHFVAHAGRAISYVAFDPSGSLLLTADRQGHDFHVFRILAAPCATKQSAVHHLYTLHRGDTTAKVQDVAFATDSRWVAVTTFRGTTHVFPISPYGGAIGVRTHASPRVVNRLSRFHRSAGLDDGYATGAALPTASGRAGSGSPVLGVVPATGTTPNGAGVRGGAADSAALFPYPNPRLPAYPPPTVVTALAQLRPAWLLGGLASTLPASPASRSVDAHLQIHDESQPLRVTTCFAASRGAATLASLAGHSHVGPGARDRLQRRTSESLYALTGHGALVEYGLEPRLAAGVARDKAGDESAVELDVAASAQWLLHCRPLLHSADLAPPLSAPALALITRPPSPPSPGSADADRQPPPSSLTGAAADLTSAAAVAAHETPDTWLAQVEINTHAGPHRRLWMGPQFTFKTLKRDSSNSSLAEIEASEVDILSRPARSNPVNMPETMDVPIQGLPVITGEGSASSYEQSPRFLTTCGRYGGQRCDSDSSISGVSMSDLSLGPKVEVELQLKENLADAMIEMPSATGSNLPDEAQGSNERRTHYFMEEERANWAAAAAAASAASVASMASSDPTLAASLHSNEEDLLDFELESESLTAASSLMTYAIGGHQKVRRASARSDDSAGGVIGGDKDYSFVATVEMLSGPPVDVAFFSAEASRLHSGATSAGDSSSNEDDVVAVSDAFASDADGATPAAGDKKSRKNRKKKK